MKSIVALLLVALAFSGCTSGDGKFQTPAMDDEGRYVIKMTAANTYSPAYAVVPVGATVVWMMEGGTHNVEPDGHSAWNATKLTSAKGVHLEVTFDEAATYGYYCLPHQSTGMIGQIKVE